MQVHYMPVPNANRTTKVAEFQNSGLFKNASVFKLKMNCLKIDIFMF